MGMNKGKLLSVLLICILLTGCQNGTEENKADPSEGSTASEPDVVAVDANGTDTSDTVDEDFSVSCSEEGTYSLKNSIQNEIMSGNFQHLEGSRERVEIEQMYNRSVVELGLYEWRQIDLNGDGIEDLILQEKESNTYKAIVAIFACEEDRADCIMLDLNDWSEYSFCGSTGELMYTAPSYGMLVAFEPYKHYHYDREWNEITDYRLLVYGVEVDERGCEYPEYAEEWKQDHPDMAEDGYYIRKYTGEVEEVLTREELLEIFETEMGCEFYSAFPLFPRTGGV